jgi:hypothetical protein
MGKFQRIGAPAVQERQSFSAVMVVEPQPFGLTLKATVSNRFGAVQGG